MFRGAGARLRERFHIDARGGPGASHVAAGAVVLLGAVLIVVTALQQPYNQNEWAQMAPYGRADLWKALGGTRQPPLDPFLGVVVQWLLGEGHLVQRLVPVASGVGSLALMAVLLRRLEVGWAAPVALLLMATAPLFLRYSAYTRPYALPVFLMLACAAAGSAWLDSGRRRWLVVAFVAGLLLPLSRVPEPSLFLVGAVAVLLIAGAGRHLPRSRAWPLAGALLLGLATAGIGMLLRLLSLSSTGTGRSLVDADPGRVLGRLPRAAAEIWHRAVPLYAEWFPWWPLTLLLVLTGLLLPASLRRLVTTWYWLPLVLAPLAFLVVFHVFVPLDLRDYRVRFAYFAVPPLVVLAGVAAHAVGDTLARRRGRTDGRWRWLGAALVAALVMSQLPATWRILTEDDTIDLAAAGRVMAQRVPEDGVVVFDGPGLMGRWRQRFFGQERFLPEDTKVVHVIDLARGRTGTVADAGPIWLLLVDAECVSSVSCDLRPIGWDGDVEGYRPVARLHHLTLYEPAREQSGLDGLVDTMRALVEAYGPQRGVINAVVAAQLLVQQGRPEAAAGLLEGVCLGHPEPREHECREHVTRRGLGRALERERP